MSTDELTHHGRTAGAVRTRAVIAIASAGRPAILAETVRHMATTLDPPADEILVCTPTAEDAAGLRDHQALRVIVGRRGLSHQRNDLLQAAASADLIVFFDDDFFPAPDYIARTVSLFEDRDDVVIATGNVILDGIHGPGVTPDEARAALAASRPAPRRVKDTYNAYGCNMAIRMDPVRRHDLRFDERLPLYAWLEDLDFSRQLCVHGRSVLCGDMIGVHLGVKAGRTPGRRLGYSQIANPWYLMNKRTMAGSRAWSQMGRNFLANVAGSLRRNPLVDRRGRLRGNLMAIGDILRRRSSPDRAQSL